MVNDIKTFFLNLFFGEDYVNFDEEEKNYIENNLNYFINELKDDSTPTVCDLSESYTYIFRSLYTIEDNYIKIIQVNPKELFSSYANPRDHLYLKRVQLFKYLKKYFFENISNKKDESSYNKKYLLTDSIDKLNISVSDFLFLHNLGINTVDDLLNYINLKQLEFNYENVEQILFRTNIRKEILYFYNQNQGKEDNLIENLNLSIRSYNILKRNGINTIGNLISYTENELVRLKGIGKIVKDEINFALKKNNLSLKKEIDKETKKEILKSLYALNLSDNIINQLQKAGINTISDLLMFTRRNLCGIDNINDKSSRKIECALIDVNLSLKKEIKLDNNINKLDLSDKTKRYLKNKKITTLEYLISLDKFDMLEIIITDKDVLNEIKEYINYIFYDRKDKKFTRIKRNIVI